ncbi:Glutathione S-transferase theta-1 [Chionoecetes opilio]|uniref:glutathione transferase n=1 Tax=Chionoecetes opilio TaxID=41210 RepID=A0A8J4YE31_CHIOP|nr:Glutathione S-transferase theta-1 [Chionoecetes opilio]
MLRLYVDLMSQPSRAVYIFMKKAKIPFQTNLVNLAKAEHRTEEFTAITPFQRVPAIDDNGFKLSESVAILRYLCREHKVEDHWYPRDSKTQARVDEYLEWQHLNTRISCAMYFQHKFLMPKMFGTEVNQKKVADFQSRMEDALETFETVWLKGQPFLGGSQISIADIIAACELEQPSMAGYDVCEGRPLLTAWFQRVREACHPHYDEGHVIVNKVRAKQGAKAPGSKL